jgi:hypothetical protein
LVGVQVAMSSVPEQSRRRDRYFRLYRVPEAELSLFMLSGDFILANLDRFAEAGPVAMVYVPASVLTALSRCVSPTFSKLSWTLSPVAPSNAAGSTNKP